MNCVVTKQVAAPACTVAQDLKHRNTKPIRSDSIFLKTELIKLKKKINSNTHKYKALVSITTSQKSMLIKLGILRTSS